MYGVGIQGEMNSSKRNVTAAGIQHSPERDASVTSKWKTLSTEVLNKKGNAKQMPNKCHAWHLNCSPPCRGMDKLWYIRVDGWMWSSVPQSACCQHCMQHNWRSRIWSSEAPPRPRSALFPMTWFGNALRRRKGLNEAPALPHMNHICLHELFMFHVALFMDCTPMPRIGSLSSWQCRRSMLQF